MNVTLTAMTQPLVRTEDNTRFLSLEEFIVYTARVSNPSNQLNTLSAPRLLAYCIKHEHWSVFEQASLTVEIQTSRAISAQILRHKSFAFQEFSQRYSVVTDLENFELRKQADINRQSSTTLLELEEEELKKVKEGVLAAVSLYEFLIEKGAAKECARNVLPLCTSTTLYMTGNIRSWLHYIALRAKPNTQLEHRLIAEEIKRMFVDVLPIISEAMSWKTSTETTEISPEQNNTIAVKPKTYVV